MLWVWGAPFDFAPQQLLSHLHSSELPHPASSPQFSKVARDLNCSSQQAMVYEWGGLPQAVK